MATTPIYSWPTPDNTDLVKDGAEAIRDLGNAIDTTVGAVSDATGLVHIETQTPSAVSSVVFNNVFSATYDDYLITYSLTTSATNELQIRVRASGTNLTGSNYFWHRANTSSNGTGYGTGSNSNGGTSFSFTGPGSASVLRAGFQLISAPFLSVRTLFNGAGNTGFASDSQGGQNFCGINLTNSYDGFDIFTASGTFTGQVRVYGYRKS